MNDSGTVGHCYVVVTVYEECFLVLRISAVLGALIERLILLVFKVAALVRLKNGVGALALGTLYAG